MAEPIEMPFGLWTIIVGPRNNVRGCRSRWEGAIWESISIVKYRDCQPHLLDGGGVQIPMGRDNFQWEGHAPTSLTSLP